MSGPAFAAEEYLGPLSGFWWFNDTLQYLPTYRVYEQVLKLLWHQSAVH
jgi:hypothetical protein